LVLFVADLFHPLDHLAVELFLNGDMRHRRCWSRAVPMFLARRKPDHVAGPDFLDQAAPSLRPATAGGHDKSLAQRVGMPGRARAGLEGDACAANTRGLRRVEQRIDANGAREIVRRSFAGRL
jgi:hypothetical protein